MSHLNIIVVAFIRIESDSCMTTRSCILSSKVGSDGCFEIGSLQKLLSFSGRSTGEFDELRDFCRDKTCELMFLNVLRPTYFQSPTLYW